MNTNEYEYLKKGIVKCHYNLKVFERLLARETDKNLFEVYFENKNVFEILCNTYWENRKKEKIDKIICEEEESGVKKVNRDLLPFMRLTRW